MKVIHLCTPKKGGAANAAFRISNALEKEDVESSVLTEEEILPRYHVLTRLWLKIKNRLYSKLIKSHAVSYYTDDLAGSCLTRLQEIKDADIIHLHWVSEGLLDLKGLKRLLKLGKPIVWTLHDMHPFTGGCHYDGNCNKYKDSCGACPVLSSTKKRDFSTFNQKKKIETIARYGNKMLIVGCSKWMAACASQSQIMRELRCINIPNCINADIFKPIEQAFARKMLNVNTNKKIILFGAMNSMSDQRKGFPLLKKTLNILDSSEYALAVFGGTTDEISDFEIFNLGYFNDELSLSLVYNIADVFVAPSVQENLANTVMEALSCGTPVTAFDIGGMPDMIHHQVNGYLAKAFEENDLVRGIAYCCKEIRNAEELHQDIQERFGERIVGEKYIEEYNRLLIG